MHPHAELMTQYARDAKLSSTPWNLWEVKAEGATKWANLYRNPRWVDTASYRRKPETILIGDTEVPAPIRKLPELNADHKVYVYVVEPTRNRVTLYIGGASYSPLITDAIATGWAHTSVTAAHKHLHAVNALTTALHQDKLPLKTGAGDVSVEYV